jgi:hypothetical protein
LFFWLLFFLKLFFNFILYYLIFMSHFTLILLIVFFFIGSFFEISSFFFNFILQYLICLELSFVYFLDGVILVLWSRSHVWKFNLDRYRPFLMSFLFTYFIFRSYNSTMSLLKIKYFYFFHFVFHDDNPISQSWPHIY